MREASDSRLVRRALALRRRSWRACSSGLLLLLLLDNAPP